MMMSGVEKVKHSPRLTETEDIQTLRQQIEVWEG